MLKGDTSLATVKELKPRQFVQNWNMSDVLPTIELLCEAGFVEPSTRPR